MDIKKIKEKQEEKIKLNSRAKISAPEVWRPQKAETYNLPKVVFPSLTLPNRKRLSKVLSFIEMSRFRRYNEGATIMPIPTTNKSFMAIAVMLLILLHS